MTSADLIVRLCQRVGAGSTVGFFGTHKNAGKTTALNAFAKQFRHSGRVALISTGRDGEQLDSIDQTIKPRIQAERGDLLVTVEQAAYRGTAGLIPSLELGSTPFGWASLYEVSSPVELVSPGPLATLSQALDLFRYENCRAVLIDGSFDRVAALRVSDYCVFSIGRSYDPLLDRVLERVQHLERIMSLPLSPLSTDSFLNSITDGDIETIKVTGIDSLTFDSPADLLLGPSSLVRLRRAGIRISVRRRPELLCFSTNPAPTRDHGDFLRCAARQVSVPVLDVVSGDCRP